MIKSTLFKKDDRSLVYKGTIPEFILGVPKDLYENPGQLILLERKVSRPKKGGEPTTSIDFKFISDEILEKINLYYIQFNKKRVDLEAGDIHLDRFIWDMLEPVYPTLKPGVYLVEATDIRQTEADYNYEYSPILLKSVPSSITLEKVTEHNIP